MCDLTTFRNVQNLTPYVPKCPIMTSECLIKSENNILNNLSLLAFYKSKIIKPWFSIIWSIFLELSYFSLRVKFQKSFLIIGKRGNTVESPNSHTQNSHIYPNSHTLFGLTKMWLFGYAKDFRRIFTKAIFFESENIEKNMSHMDTFDAKSSRVLK